MQRSVFHYVCRVQEDFWLTDGIMAPLRTIKLTQSCTVEQTASKLKHHVLAIITP